jgi:hypothetical protein
LTRNDDNFYTTNGYQFFQHQVRLPLRRRATTGSRKRRKGEDEYVGDFK